MAERNDLHDMSPEELELECQHLRDENHQLQLRILGVNELARLLQDRSELVQVLEEKNKRLEIAVVRLENRCANYDRMLKSQKGANVPTAKPGQSPFIPGPSRQILEGLMKENSDLKKTVSNLTGKGAAGYLEAVKATQLEEVIDQQKQEIEFLKDQINQLTSTGIIEEKGDSSVGQLSSLPANASLPASVSDNGPLKRQVIQLQRTMKVKDRFCTLLSQQVSQLQNRLASLEFEAQDGEGSAESTTTGQPQQESSAHEARVPQEPGLSGGDGDSTYKKLYDETKDELAKEREGRVSLVDKMSKLESQLKEKGQTIDKLEQRCDELTSYHQTLLLEKSELNQVLSETQQRMESLSISGSEGGSPQRSTSEPNVEHLRRELRSSNDQVSDLRAQLEEANVQTAIANSQLATIESKHAQQMEERDNLLQIKNQEVRGYQEKIRHNEVTITDLSETIKDLEEDIRAKDSEHSELLREISEGKHTSTIGGIPTSQILRMPLRSGGAPALFGLETPIGPDDVAVKDYAGTPQQQQKIRNPSMQIPLISRGTQKQPPNNLDLHTAQQPQGRASPAPHGIHPSQMQGIQAKGTQQQLSTPATPLAPNQPHQSYTHPMGTTPSTSYMQAGGSQMMYGNVNMPMGQQSRMQPGQGGMTSRPRTMPITCSPSPTPGSTQRTLGTGSVGSTMGRPPYTTGHHYSGAPISTTAPYSANMGIGSSGMGTHYSGGVAPTSSYGGVPTQGGYAGGRGMQPRQMYSSGQGQSVFGGNTHASHMYGSSSPQLQHQQQYQQQIPPYSRTESSSSGYASGEISYSGGMSGGSGMRPTSPRSTFGQQNPPGGYPGAQQGGPSGQYGMRPTSPRSGSGYDPTGSYPGGQGGGAGGQHGFPPRGQH